MDTEPLVCPFRVSVACIAENAGYLWAVQRDQFQPEGLSQPFLQAGRGESQLPPLCILFFLFVCDCLPYRFITTRVHQNGLEDVFLDLSTPVWFVQQTDCIGENNCSVCHAVDCKLDALVLLTALTPVLNYGRMNWRNLTWAGHCFFFFNFSLAPFTQLPHTCSTMHFHAHLQTGFSCARSKVNVWQRFLCRAAVAQLCSRFYFFLFFLIFLGFFFLFLLLLEYASPWKANRKPKSFLHE